MKIVSISQIKLIGISALFFLMTAFVAKPHELKRSDYLPPPVAVKYLSVGFAYQFADSLWLRAIQDFDYCEAVVNQTECKGKSWLFQTLNLATELDPRFEPSLYQMAGLALTIIISDYMGASIIFDKAVKQYPNDWNVTYSAAYHALFEEKNKPKAARLYLQAAQNGAPEWVYSLAGRVAMDGGEEEYSKKILQGMIDSNIDPVIIDRLKKKIGSKQ